MATPDMIADKGFFSIIRNSFVPAEYDKEIVRLSVGGNTARVGMIVTYSGEVTDSSPETHRDVDLAVAENAAGNAAFTFAGIILGPVPIPLDTDPDWNIDTLLVDGTFVEILKPTGGRAKVSVFVLDPSADLLPGQMMSLGTGGGKLSKTVMTFSATPTVEELEAAVGSLSEFVGRIADVEEDNAGDDLIANIWY